MEAWQATVQDEAGNAVFNPQITVYESDGVTIASIYNEDGSPKANPFTGSLEGFAQFWAGPGVYKIRGSNGGQTELWSAKMSPIVTPMDFGARGDGSVNDAPAVREWAQSDPEPKRYRMTQPLTGLPAERVADFRGATLTRDTVANMNMIGGAGIDGYTFRNGVVDMNRREVGDLSGHGMSLSGHDVTIRDMEFRDFGSSGSGGGSGVSLGPAAGNPHALRPRLLDSKFSADPGAPLSFGYVLANVQFGILSRLYVENVRGGNAYAHELKNDARHNSLAQLVAADSSVAVAFGQDTPGVDGSDYNVVTNFVGARCDQGIIIGEGDGNVFVGGVHDAQGSPENSPRRAIQLTGGASQNVISNVSLFGDLQRAVTINGDRNAIEVASHITSGNLVVMDVGAKGNVISFAHTGDQTSIIPYITDNSGSGITGSDGNVFRSDSTGERIGSRSGHFHDKLGDSGASFATVHNWRFESDGGVFLSGATPGESSSFGLVHNIPGTNNLAQFSSVAAPAGNYWNVRVASVNAMRIYSDRFNPMVSGYDLGTVSARFGTGYFDAVNIGNGASGTFETADNKTVTVVNGIITAIV